MATAKDAAAWMLAELEKRGSLDQRDAADHLHREYGDQFTFENENGNLAIKKKVLEAFRKLGGDDVVWERGYREWRKRRDYDKPGRQQD